MPTDARFYQFVSDYVAMHVLTPQIGLQTIQFDLPDRCHEALVTTHVRDDQERCRHAEQSVRIRLRTCKYPKDSVDFETTGAAVAATDWPENIYISLNDQHLQPRRKQHFHHDLPIELTHTVQEGKNTVTVSLPVPLKIGQTIQKYLMLVEVIEIWSAETLKKRIQSHEHFTVDEMKVELRRRLNGADDDEIVVADEHLSLSVTDPFSLRICTTPVRSIHCKHVECFDLDNWLETRQGKPSRRQGEPSKVDEWKCPICGGDARPQTLSIDDFFAQVREKLLADGAERTKLIRIDKECNWSAVVEQDDSDDEDELVVAAAPSRDRQTSRSRNRETAVIILDDDDD